MKMFILFLGTALLFLSSPASPVSYPPPSPEPLQLTETTPMRAGARVQLFHSGTPDVVNGIKPGDLLTVYTEYTADAPLKETGKVKVLGATGSYYFEGEVVEGFVQTGNLAVKNGIACIVITRSRDRR
jgi:hypothetical protein